MAADSYGDRGEPQFAGSGASADAEDLTLLGAHIADSGNRKVGTTTQRNAATAATNPVEVWDGLVWRDTTLKRDLVRDAGQWKPYGATLLGTDGVLRGTVPPAMSGVLIQTGNTVLRTNVSGDASLTFPTAFPNGLLSFLAMDGNQDAVASPFVVAINTAVGSNGVVSMRFRRGTTDLADVNVRISWIAMGW